MLISAACERNKDPILNILKNLVHSTNCTKILEIGCGTFQHAEYFMNNLANIKYTPTD